MVRLIMRVQMALALIAVFIAPVFGGEVYFNDFNAAPGTKYPEWTSTGYSNSAKRHCRSRLGATTCRERFITQRQGTLPKRTSEAPAILTGRPSIRNIS